MVMIVTYGDGCGDDNCDRWCCCGDDIATDGGGGCDDSDIWWRLW